MHNDAVRDDTAGLSLYVRFMESFTRPYKALV